MQNNREIKSSVFADLFGDDELVGKKNFLALYNAIHGTNLKFEETQIERKTISQSLVNTFNNDVSMEIDGKLIVFIEHQSTINKNMPLRFLEYFVHILYGIVPARARYKNVLYKIPSPEFYVFYNGKKKPLKENELKLSDAFLIPQEEPLCELKVNIVNIGGEEGLTLPIVKNCVILKEYCEFIETMLKGKATLPENCTKEDAQVALEKVIRECLTKNILTDYLTRKGTEIINMFLDEYDYETDIAVKQEEAKEEGAQQNAIKTAIALLKEGDPPEKIARCTELPLEKVLELQEQITEKA